MRGKLARVSFLADGSVKVSTDGSDVSDEELISALQTSIADALNVHSSDVVVTIDPDTGLATYTVSSATAEEAEELQKELQTSATNAAITSGVQSTLPAITNVN